MMKMDLLQKLKRATYFVPIILYLVLTSIVFGAGISEQKSSGWTIETLKEYYDQRFEALQLAIIKAEQATEKRFESVNEFRTTLSDQSRTFMPRSESEAKYADLSNRVTANTESIKKIENMKQGGNVAWSYLIAGAALLIAVVSASGRFQKQNLK